MAVWCGSPVASLHWAVKKGKSRLGFSVAFLSMILEEEERWRVIDISDRKREDARVGVLKNLSDCLISCILCA
jgi:hypothetical protein